IQRGARHGYVPYTANYTASMSAVYNPDSRGLFKTLKFKPLGPTFILPSSFSLFLLCGDSDSAPFPAVPLFSSCFSFLPLAWLSILPQTNPSRPLVPLPLLCLLLRLLLRWRTRTPQQARAPPPRQAQVLAGGSSV